MAWCFSGRSDRRETRQKPGAETQQTRRVRSVSRFQRMAGGFNIRASEEGDKSATLSCDYPAGTTHVFSAPDSNKWLCVEDRVDPVSSDPSVTSNFTRHQTWETSYAWADEDFL